MSGNQYPVHTTPSHLERISFIVTPNSGRYGCEILITAHFAPIASVRLSNSGQSVVCNRDTFWGCRTLDGLSSAYLLTLPCTRNLSSITLYPVRPLSQLFFHPVHVWGEARFWAIKKPAFTKIANRAFLKGAAVLPSGELQNGFIAVAFIITIPQKNNEYHWLQIIHNRQIVASFLYCNRWCRFSWIDIFIPKVGK